MKTATVIPDQEHQVEQVGVANTTHQSAQVVGPKGDFYGQWNWDHQSKDTQWNPAGPYGSNYTGNMPTEVSVGSDPTTANAGPAILLQTGVRSLADWVELPKCSDEADRVPLENDLSNAAQATCVWGTPPGQPDGTDQLF